MSWPIVNLGDIAEFIRGVTFKPHDLIEFGTNDFVVCMRTKNIQEDLDESDLISLPKNLIKNKTKFLKKGDLLISTANSFELVGKSCWVPELDYPAVAGGFISILRAKQELLYPRYLFHWMKTSQTQSLLRNCGRQTTNISNMDFERAKKLRISLPPLNEQKSIAAILDKVEAVRRKRQQAIELSEQLLRSVFLDMFGDPMANPYDWPYKNLKELIINGPQNGLYEPSSKYGSGTPIVRIDSFYHGHIENIASLKRVRTDEPNIARYKLQKDDILINRVNSRSHLGKCALITHLNEPTIFESNMMRFSIDKSQINVYYFITILQHQFVKQQILSRCKDSVNQSSINQGDVNSICFPLPLIALQEKFGGLHKKISTFKSKLEEDKKGIEDILNALTQKAFRGELCKQLDSELA